MSQLFRKLPGLIELQALSNSNLTLHSVDIRDSSSLDTAINNADIVVHLASSSLLNPQILILGMTYQIICLGLLM